MLILVLITGSSCNVTKYLEPGQTFLEKNEIEFTTDLDRYNRAIVKQEISNYLIQEQADGFLWIPRPWFYYRNREKQKDNWYWRFVEKNLSQTPPIVSQDILDRTVKNMEEYLLTRGYLYASVTPTIDTGKYYSTVNYMIEPGALQYIDSFTIECTDSALLQVIEENRNEEYLSVGLPFVKEAYTSEVQNIVNIAQNNGYLDFSSNFIDKLAIDTSRGENWISLRILTPYGQKAHRQYRIDEISIFPHSSSLTDSTIQINSIAWGKPLDSFLVKQHFLQDKITIRPRSLYAKDQYVQTLSNLANYAIYLYPRTKVLLDTSTNTVDMIIGMNKGERRSYGTDFDLFYSDISQVNNQLVGLSNSHTLVDRNLFGGGEILRTTVEGSFELGLQNADANRANSYNLKLSSQLQLPRFTPFPIFYGVANQLFPSSLLLRDFQERANTVFSIDYQFTQRQSFYTYNSVTASSGYQYNPRPEISVQLNHLGINYWVPRIEPTFDTIIGPNEFFRRRFSKRFLTGFLFNTLSVIVQKPQNTFGESYFFLTGIETSGLEVLGAEAAYSLLGGNTPFVIRTRQDSITFSKFIRLDIDGRYFRTFKNNSSIGLRMTAGLGIGLDPGGVPYIRQFFVGGPYSIRAWALRALGPGSFRPSRAFEELRLPFFQTGDFMFEMNAEYRFPLIWLLEGAVFIDAGNVWNLTDENSDYNLSWDSYKQIAIGTGFGFRFLFPFDIIFRLDLGYPIRYPYEIRGSHWIFNQEFRSSDDSIFRPLQLNFAIGYPF